MKAVTAASVCAIVASLAVGSHAVNGVAVSVHSSYTQSFGHAVGNIKRFIITSLDSHEPMIRG